MKTPNSFTLFLLGIVIILSQTATATYNHYATSANNHSVAGNPSVHHSEARGFDNTLLVKYDLKCNGDGKAPVFPDFKGVPAWDGASILTACKALFNCDTFIGGDKKVLQQRPSDRRAMTTRQWNWCNSYCTCEQVDEPMRHYSYHFGCVGGKAGGWVQGVSGSSIYHKGISRDNNEPVDLGDGFKMQANFGPVRKY